MTYKFVDVPIRWRGRTVQSVWHGRAIAKILLRDGREPWTKAFSLL